MSGTLILSRGGAEKFATFVHEGQLDKDGRPHIEHVSRVAAIAPAEAKRAAWLHDVVEDCDVTLNDLRALGLPEPEVMAVALVTRFSAEKAETLGQDRLTYREFIGRIASADGKAGRIAQAVKEADMLDNLSRCIGSDDEKIRSLADRYRQHLPTILRARRKAKEPT